MGKKRKKRTGQNRAGFDMRKKYTIRHTYMNTWSCRQTEPFQGRKAKVQKREKRRKKKARPCTSMSIFVHRPQTSKERQGKTRNQPTTNQPTREGCSSHPREECSTGTPTHLRERAKSSTGLASRTTNRGIPVFFSLSFLRLAFNPRIPIVCERELAT